MKKILVSLALISCTLLFVSAQVTLKDTYQSGVNSSTVEFRLAEIDSGVFKYLNVNLDNEEIKLYNLNHTLYKTIDIPLPYVPYKYRIQYVTRSLFDCDTSNIEYLLLWTNGDAGFFNDTLRLYSEDGTVLFEEAPGFMGWICVGCATIISSYIRETPDGTEMQLDNFTTGETRIYNLCGTLPTSYESGSNSDNLSFRSYPNPAKEFATIQYHLPDNVKEATLNIYDQQGIEVKSFQIDNTFSNVLLSSDDLISGTYYYNIFIPGFNTEAKKMVIIK